VHDSLDAMHAEALKDKPARRCWSFGQVLPGLAAMNAA
jgi:hypothetical protein